MSIKSLISCVARVLQAQLRSYTRREGKVENELRNCEVIIILSTLVLKMEIYDSSLSGGEINK